MSVQQQEPAAAPRRSDSAPLAFPPILIERRAHELWRERGQPDEPGAREQLHEEAVALIARELAAGSHSTNGNGAKPTIQEVLDDLGARDPVRLCANLIGLAAHFAERLKMVQEERDSYAQAIYAMTDREIEFTKEEIFAHLGEKPTIQEVIAEMERECEES